MSNVEQKILPLTSQQIVVEEGAHVEIVFWDDTPVETGAISEQIVIRQAKDSFLKIIFLMFAGSHSVTLQVEQEGEGAELQFFGLSVNEGEHKHSLHTQVVHAVPNCKSSQLYKCIVRDKAESNFVGELKVLPHAQKTEAYQTNRNLLLSTEARVNTKPQLEIYADDVHCSHGASTGQLDESALFYMQQRCIAPEMARKLLVNAFMQDVLQEISDETLREQIQDLLTEKN